MSEPLHCPVCRCRIPTPAPAAACPRCRAVVHRRKPGSTTRAAAFALAAAAMLVPANVLPIMKMETLGHVQADTILSGVALLWHEGMWGIAAIVFTASLLVPILKLFGLGLLLQAVRRPRHGSRRLLTRVYTFVHFIGRWSMLDVFLIAFLSGAVRFSGLARVEARPGALAFAAAVVLTMLATAAFDPRLLWDDPPAPYPPPPAHP